MFMYWYSPFDSRIAWLSGLKMLKHSLDSEAMKQGFFVPLINQHMKMLSW